MTGKLITKLRNKLSPPRCPIVIAIIHDRRYDPRFGKEIARWGRSAWLIRANDGTYFVIRKYSYGVKLETVSPDAARRLYAGAPDQLVSYSEAFN